jgi:hypothetical protein
MVRSLQRSESEISWSEWIFPISAMLYLGIAFQNDRKMSKYMINQQLHCLKRNMQRKRIKTAKPFTTRTQKQTVRRADSCASSHKPNVVVERLAFLPASYSGGLRSNLGPRNDYPDWGGSWFSSVPPRKLWNSTWNQAMSTSFHILSNSSFTSSFHLKQ